MKQFAMICLLAVISGFTAFAQEKDTQKNVPDEQSFVNKEYDENGNLIRFDSTYIFKWHGDSLVAFPKGNGFFFTPGNFPDMEGMFKGFFSDSSFMSLPFGFNMNDPFFDRNEFFSPFGFPHSDSAFFRHFSMNPDSAFFRRYSFGPDSTFFSFPGDSLFEFRFGPGDFEFPGMPDFGFHEFDGAAPGDEPFFENEEQQKEWQQLMEKQQEEMEQFRKKWEEQNNPKKESGSKYQKI